MIEFKNLKKDILELYESIGNGEVCDNENCHYDEDQIKDEFIYAIRCKYLTLDEIEEIAKLIDDIPYYTKWYA